MNSAKRWIALAAAMTILMTATACGKTESVSESCAHTWQTATCEVPKTCSNCGETQGVPDEHLYVEATCEEAKVCVACGNVFGRPLGHDYKGGSCIEKGVCSRCDAVALTFDSHRVIPATCTEAAVCSVCDAEVSSPLEHNFKGGTCTEGAVCSRCNTTQEPMGHDYSDATCTEKGVCSRCGDKTSPLGHVWVDATCTAPETCSRCGETRRGMIAHDFERATCTTPETCVDCGTTRSPALGHDFNTRDCRRLGCDAINPSYVDPALTSSLRIPSCPVNVFDKKGYYRITDISYEFENDFGLKTATLKIYYSGTKIPDEYGLGPEGQGSIQWKLYDADNNVVKSGTVYTPRLAVNESFYRETSIISKLSPGSYRLELGNVY